MRRWLWVSLLGWLGCAPHAPPGAVKAPNAVVDQNAEHVLLCANTIDEHDVPHCVGELTQEQQRRRSRTERLLIRGGRVIRKDVISGSGAPLLGSRSLVYGYRDGRVTGWTVETPNGVLQEQAVVSADGAWVKFLDEQDRPRIREQSHASGVRRTLDPRGRVTSLAWVNHRGDPVTVGAVHETRYGGESASQQSESYYGLRGEAVEDAEGVHRVERRMTAWGDDVELRYFDAAGKPASGRHSHVVRIESDAFGNSTSVSLFDAKGQPTHTADASVASQRFGLDQRGNTISMELHDERGEPTTGSGGYAKLERRFDDLDRLVEIRYYGAKRAPVRHAKTGAAAEVLVRNARGNVVSRSLFDERGAATLGSDGYHREEIAYDERDNPISNRYFDANGSRTMLKGGYSALRANYDGDRLVRVEYLNTNDEPTLTSAGYASYELSYAADGSPEAPRRFDLKGLLQLKCDGEITAQLQKELSERAASSKSCYERLLRYGEAGEGRLMVELKIDERGEVLASQLVQDDIGDTALADCLLGVLREPYENKPDGGCAAVRIPLAFVQKR